MRIYGWAADEASGCWWYRIKLPLDALRDQGHEVAYGPRLPPEWWDKPEVIIGQRVATPEASARWQQLRDRRDRPLLVYELDDDLLNVDPANTKAYRFFAQYEVQDNVRRNIAAADLVIASTEPLADQLRTLNSNVVVLPNRIPRRLLQHPLVADPAPGARTVIGWAGSQSHRDDFDEVAAELVRFVKRNPGVVYCSMGLILNGQPGVFSSLKGLPPAQVSQYGWWPLPDYYGALEFHIGLAPLRPSIFNRSKSPIKAMEYAARGVALIASNTGPYADYVQPGVTGLLADLPHEWARHLRDLVHDHGMRHELVANARAHVAQLTIEDHAHEWADAIHTALTGRPTQKETAPC